MLSDAMFFHLPGNASTIAGTAATIFAAISWRTKQLLKKSPQFQVRENPCEVQTIKYNAEAWCLRHVKKKNRINEQR
jgi:hypothetical protein